MINYQKIVRDTTNYFKYFNIRFVPRSQNVDADLLANTTSKLIPPECLSIDMFSINLIEKPSIPNNVTNWKVFDDDQKILDFLIAQDTFKDVAIDEANHDKSLSDPNFLSNLIAKSIINFKRYYDLRDKSIIQPTIRHIVLP